MWRVLCWYGRAAVNRFDAGSIPASTALGRRTRITAKFLTLPLMSDTLLAQFVPVD